MFAQAEAPPGDLAPVQQERPGPFEPASDPPGLGIEDHVVEGVLGALDRQPNPPVAGGTNSDDFPTTPGGYDTTYGGGSCGAPPYSAPCPDAFVTKLNLDGTDLVYGTYLGADDWDYAFALSMDPGDARSLTLTGQAEADFPTTPGGYDTSHNGSSDIFVANLLTGSEATMYVRDIRLRYRVRPGDRYQTQGLVRMFDGDDQPVAGVLVSAEWTLPSGAMRLQQRQTNATGVARFGSTSRQIGAYELCITGVTAADYLYDPDQNWETCDDLIVP